MRKIILILLLFIAATSSYANTRYTTKSITTIDGLSQNDVKSIVQDSYGFLWIATNDGLCRYDGYEFRIFTTPDLGMQSNLILSITEDKWSNIWIGTADKGLFIFERNREQFRHYSELSDNTLPYIHSARNLCIAPNGDILAIDSRNGTIIKIRYNNEREQITRFRSYDIGSNEKISITTLTTTPSKIYAGTNRGVYLFDFKEDRFNLIESRSRIPSVIDIEAKGEILFISSHNSFVSFNTRTKRVIKHEFNSNPIYIHFVGQTMWFTTKSGVYTSNYAPRRESFYGTQQVDEYSDFTSHTITSDHNRGVWIGFSKEGMRRYERDNKPFSTISGLGNNHIFPIYSLDDGRTFIGTEGSGLFLLDSLTQSSGATSYLDRNTIHTIDYSPYDDKIYFACHNRVYSSHRSNPTTFDVAFNTPMIRKILADGEYLWMASYNRGLIRYNLKDSSSLELSVNDNLPSTLLRNLMLDSHGNLWICSERGVSMIESSERLSNYPAVTSILNNSEAGNRYTIPIIESSKGDIWYGTMGHGLYRLRSTTSGVYEVMNITHRDGLSNNTIKAIVEDREGDLWVSTNRGVNRVRYSTTAQHSIARGENKGVSITKYNMNSGLQNYEFNELSSTQLSDGTILFGGVAGFNFFKPNDIRQDSIAAKGVITDLMINNRSIYDERALESVIPTGLQGSEGYKLNYNQNSITIKFAALHYLNPEMNRYKFCLEGYNREWITTPEGVRVASFVNLPPGRYTFALRVSNSDGIWSDTTLSIPIVITPPFWASWYAYIIYAVVLLMIGMIIITYAHDTMERRNTMALAQMEREKMNELLEVRTRFFTNISHEFRTPLTLILSPLQELSSDSDLISNKRWSDMVRVMSHNGNSLMRLINEFLSYTKQESGELRLCKSSGEFIHLARGLFDQFKFWSDQRGLRLCFQNSIEEVNIEYDPYLIEQVIYNLVSNAIKHTPSGGEITMSITESEQSVILSVQDNGHGVPEHKQPHIFKRFFSSATESSKEVGGTGVGLYLSKSIVSLHGGEIWFDSIEGEGTTFYFSLPKGESPIEGERGVDNLIQSNPSTFINACREEERADDEQPTLLIIDDNIDLLHLLHTLFDHSYRVLMAENGVDGLDTARRVVPDIIISDVMMPQMDGLELCDRLKNDTVTSHIPVILLSAKATADDMVAGLRNSADAYCAKPFNNEVLREMVATLLNNRQKLALKYATPTNEQSESKSTSLFDYDDHNITSTDNEFINRLVRYIEDNIHNPNLVVSDLCSEMGVTALVLNKKLKSLIGMTANALIRTIKLRRAAQLLRTTRYTIADVTYDVGFNDLRYFRECFKKEYGVLPQEYKDQCTEQER
ncbi:MAG: ATP-binding protein [Rikenellaceae bacterium]